MADEPPKFDPFKPAEPRLPGVPEKKPAAPVAPAEPEKLKETVFEAPTEAPPSKLEALKKIPPKWLAAGGAGLVVLIVLLWIVLKPASEEITAPPLEKPPSAASAPAGEAPASTEPAPPATAGLVTLPGPVATLDEMAKPWSYKLFSVRRGGERVPAVLVRLPGAPKSSASYWGFSLRTPYGRCDLEYVADLEKLANDFGYRADHPMIVDPCTSTVFDPARYGSIGGAYARGAVVSGSGLRPPLAIEVQVQGNQILAIRTE